MLVDNSSDRQAQMVRVLLVVLATILAIVGWSRWVSAQALKAGIHVELAVTTSAPPMPDADNENALVVAVTDNGSVYLEVDPIAPGALAARVRSRLASRRDTKVYVKADARTPYAGVATVLEAVRAGGYVAPTLLTGPRGPGAATGLEVSVGSALSAAEKNAVLVKADGRTPYSQVVQVIDASHAMGARVVLVLPAL